MELHVTSRLLKGSEDIIIWDGERRMEIPGTICDQIATLYRTKPVPTVVVVREWLKLSIAATRDICETISRNY